MATVAVSHMSPTPLGPQRKIYSGEATEAALFELVYYDKQQKKPETPIVERDFVPFSFDISPLICTPAAKTVPAFNTTPVDSNRQKIKFEKKKQSDNKAAKSAGRLIPAARPGSPDSQGKTPMRSSTKNKKAAGSTATALAPAPNSLPPPPPSLLF